MQDEKLAVDASSPTETDLIIERLTNILDRLTHSVTNLNYDLDRLVGSTHNESSKESVAKPEINLDGKYKIIHNIIDDFEIMVDQNIRNAKKLGTIV